MNKKKVVLAVAATTSSKSAEENLGIAYLVAVLRSKGINAVIIDGWMDGLSPQQLIDRIKEEGDIAYLGFSCNLLNADAAISIVQQLKSDGYRVPTVAGGFGATFNPEKFLEGGFDYVSMQEGEEAILPLYDFFVNGEKNRNSVPGLCYYANGELYKNEIIPVKDLDTLPFPVRDTMHHCLSSKTPVNVLTSRGCNASCLFCSVAAFWRVGHTQKWRERSIGNIVEELEELYQKGVRYIKFVDDSFLEPPRDEAWCNHFADEICKRQMDIQFRITLRADRVSYEKMMALKRAGCDSVACGIENFSPSALKRMGKRANLKQNCEAIDIFKKCGLYVQMGFILFDYGTTMQELYENYEYMVKYSWTICRGIFSEMYAAKGTLYTEMLLKNHIIEDVLHFGNYVYDIADPDVQKVFRAIKKWHISHMIMYNMVIEPLNKPKALNIDETKAFYNLYQRIRKIDLDYFGEILDRVTKGISEKELDNFVDHAIQKTENWFGEWSGEVLQLYTDCGLVYTAEEDPFTVFKDRR